jgi:glutamine cyclotransferase
LLIVSDVKPGKFRYNIVKEFPHSIHSYTQGLEFYNELLFEGTGQYGRSKIMNVNPLNGKALKSFSLRNDLFGEGITILDDKIYQLTWKNRKGFVYKLPDLIPVDSFMLQSEEGWGLTNDGTHLIMSNGSHNLLWIDPLNYKVVKFVQVANHIDVINNLNELEYIDGTIYANVFTTNIIIQIDPETGKVLNEINLDGLIDKYRNLSDSIDVLNGIAWKKADKRLFVTGKNWPRLFEIKIIPSK